MCLNTCNKDSETDYMFFGKNFDCQFYTTMTLFHILNIFITSQEHYQKMKCFINLHKKITI